MQVHKTTIILVHIMNEALSNAQSYVYIADLVMISEINNYPYSYTLGDGSVSCNDNKGVNYINVPLQPNTQYAIVIRADTADDLVNCMHLTLLDNIMINCMFVFYFPHSLLAVLHL